MSSPLRIEPSCLYLWGRYIRTGMERKGRNRPKTIKLYEQSHYVYEKKGAQDKMTVKIGTFLYN